MSKRLIQDFVSRPQSLKAVWSEQNWKFGPESFFRNDIPFSIRNGTLFASKLVDVFLSNLQKSEKINDETQINIAEFGAGIGFLSSLFMNKLKEKSKAIANRVVLYVTDSSQEMIDSMKTSILFDEFKSQIIFKKVDASSIGDSIPSLFFAFSAYLLDSLPAHHFYIENGEAQELLVKSYIKDSESVILTTTETPSLLKGNALEVFIKNNAPEESYVISAQCINNVDEEFKKVKLSSNHFLTPFIDEQKKNSEGVFNASEAIMNHISQVYDLLEDEGQYLVSDFGYSRGIHKLDEETLVACYSTSMFSTVSFEFLFWIINSKNGHYIITDHSEDQTQELLISKKEINKEVKDTFLELFSDPGYHTIAEVLEDISKLKKDEAYKDNLVKLQAKLSKEEQEDYFYLSTLATQLIDDGYFDQAQSVVKKIMDVYQDRAFDAYRLLGCLCQNSDDHHRAVQCFAQAISIVPNDPMTTAAIGISLLYLEQYEEAADAFKQAFNVTTDASRWSSALAVVLAYRHANLEDKAKKAIKWPLNLEAQMKGLVPSHILEKLENQNSQLN